MNTKHISLAFATVAVAALLAGCAKGSVENELLTDLELSHVGAAGSKAAIDGTTFPEDGKIGLSLFEDEAAAQLYGDAGYSKIG